MKEPLVSVIIPVYNTEKYLTKCLDSIVEQTYRSIEIIIVNNASDGEVIEIFSTYSELYPDRKWKIVSHKENQGLLKARISGVEISNGDYIAFLDSDDRISCDFYRLLVKKATENSADMVAAETIYEMKSGGLLKTNLSLLEMFQEKVNKSDLLEFLYMNEGKCFSLHLVWNKLYSRKLWNKAYPFLRNIKKHIVMCEDYVFSTVFFAFAKNLYIEHNSQYYYYKGDDAYTSQTASYDKLKKNIEDVGVVFDITKSFLIKIGRYEELRKYHLAFQMRYYRIWDKNIEKAELSNLKKLQLKKMLKLSISYNEKYNNETKIRYDDIYSGSLTSEVKDLLEFVKKQIINTNRKYISFDIFDTLILRPFLSPEDLFKILDIKLKEIGGNKVPQISEMRILAEKSARNKQKIKNAAYQDITLDEIYAEMCLMYEMPSTTAEIIKKTEILLEIEFCQPRKTGKELFELAEYLEKQIFFTSDMYLPKDVIEKMLTKCGYSLKYPLFLSSETRVAKYTGDLYKYIIKKTKVSGMQILHIGDNMFADYEAAKRSGINAIHFPRAVDVLKGYAPTLNNGNFYKEAFCVKTSIRDDSSLDFFAIRCMLAIIANKIYDNPFIEFNLTSHFNACPYYIGYMSVGMYVLGLSFWLKENTENYKRILFIARDGFLVYLAYMILFPEKEKEYLYVSRKALVPLMIESSDSFFKLKSVMKYSSVSARQVFSLLQPILPKAFNAEGFCASKEFLLDKVFSSEEEFDCFLCQIQKECYDEERVSSYRREMKAYFSRQICNLCATFDVGYSGRTEKILGILMEKRIDAFYVHLNGERALLNAQEGNFKIQTFFPGTPVVTGAVRELLTSEIAPSCIGYAKDTSGKISPQFEIRSPMHPQDDILGLIHDGALDFIRDYYNVFKKYMDEMPFRYQDAAIPFEFFLDFSSDFDRCIFKIFDFEDDLFLGRKVTLYDFWNSQTLKSSNFISENLPSNFLLPPWKKAIIYAITNRKKLKDAVKKKLVKYPLLFYIAKISYSIPRFVYHLFKK